MQIFVEEYRLKKDLSLSELSRCSRVAKSHIHGIEGGITVPTIVTLCKLAKALNVPCSDLFSCD